MTEEIKKKRMSKGCMVALIVVGVLFLMVVIAGVTCWIKKDELAKYGVKSVVMQIGSKASENPQAGVDTTMVNAVISAFSERLDSDTTINLELLGTTIQKIQYMPQDDVIDSIEVIELMNVLSEIYPELAEISIPSMEEAVPDTTAGEDTTASE